MIDRREEKELQDDFDNVRKILGLPPKKRRQANMAKRVLSFRYELPIPANHSGCWMGECVKCQEQRPIEIGKKAPEGWDWIMQIMKDGIYELYCSECLKGMREQ